MKLDALLKVILEFLQIGKSTAKGIQISGDASLAKRMKKAIDEENTEKIRRMVERGGILVDGNDIYGVFKHKEKPGVLISVDMMVRYIIMKKLIKRYQRKGD